MINRRMLGLGKEPSAIRQLYAYGLQRKAEIGDENVYDLSIGNPSVPAPESVRQRITDLLEIPAAELHGYSMAAGLMEVRQAVADNLHRRFGISATAANVYMTTGATSALAIVFSALTQPGEQVIVNAPHFPEYKVLIESAGAECVRVPMRPDNFQLDIEALDRAIVPQTAAVVVNSPNNPVGCIYTEETIRALGELMTAKEEEFGHTIYLISDEPYREITYGAEVPFVPNYYRDTVICYSWAKSLSLPGERIGYVYVSDNMPDAAETSAAVAGAGRALGNVCAPVLFQRVIQMCQEEPADVEAYARNRKMLTEGLDALGYEYIEPDGAFYLWVRALEDDAQAFSDRAKARDLLVVASDSFGCGGWVRCSYCVAPEVIEGSLKAWKLLKEDYA